MNRLSGMLKAIYKNDEHADWVYFSRDFIIYQVRNPRIL